MENPILRVFVGSMYLNWLAWGSRTSPKTAVVKTNYSAGGFPDSGIRGKIVAAMFLRKTERRKNGKTHVYWSVVENRRLDSGRVVQRHVHYLGEINSSQAEAWRKAIEVFDEDQGRSRPLALFPDDRCEVRDDDVIRLRLSEMRLCRPRQWGACWLAGVLWRELRLDRFWAVARQSGWEGGDDQECILTVAAD